MTFSRWLIIALLLVAQTGFAEVREIELKDGSVITGTVRSFDGDTYIIESDSLGAISLSNSKIHAIRSAGSTNAGQSMSPSELMGIQQQLMNDAEIMDLIKALQTDPQIQAILNDPQLLQSITEGDVQALMNNAKFKTLIDHPKIQEISNKVQP
ncbi:hypothetical protein [Kaarinaea lacus]